MSAHRFGPNFPRLFAAALLQEIPFALLLHLPGYLSDLGVTEALIGVLFAVSAAISLLLRPAMGRLLDLTHRRTILLVGGLINVAVIFSLITADVWGPYLWVLFLAWRTVQITLFTAMLTYGADSIPVKRRTEGLAIFGLSGLMPIAIGGYFGDVVIDKFGFDGLFVLAGAIGLVSWLIVRTLPTLPVRGRQPRRSFWAPLVQKNMLPLWFVALLFAIGLESMFTFTRTYVDDRQIGTAGAFFAAYGIAAALARIAGRRFYDRIRHRPLLVGSIAAYGTGLGIMALAGSEFSLMAAAVVSGTAHGVVFPLLSSEVVNRARISERGSAMTVFTSLFDIALLLGAPVVGYLIVGFDYLVAFSAVGVTLIAGAVVYGIWDRRMVAASALVGEESLE